MTDPYEPAPGTFRYSAPGEQNFEQPRFQAQAQQPNAGFTTGSAYDGPPPGTDVGNDISKSFSWAWQAFTKNWVALVVPGIIWAVVYAALLAIFFVGYFASIIALANGAESGNNDGAEAVAVLVFVLIVFLVMFLIQLPLAAWISGAYRAAGLVARGEKPTIGSGLFHWKTFLTSILYGVISIFSIIIPFLGQLACLFFFSLAPYLSAGRDAGPITAFKEAANKALAKPAHVILAPLVSFAVMFVLAITGIGLILLPAALPFVALFYMSMINRIEGTRPAPVV
ncbi:hypothetical protein [Dermabacter sp. HSID17554]|uniref:hypothetical protein n=1 Tax=Dermabacter sp. HSID17554 TaxID=2419511 RepID=UPI000F8615BA|nr:hypothetical protein [Dermabacter sp. HSID17554]RUP85868.1 hypothetical protein D8M36_08375 [Dermabacter sp. HSID17554]